jgi:hypothetical protein
MRRREFIAGLGAAAFALPRVVHAQQGERMRRIGVLLPAAADDAEFQARLGAFLQALALSGWTIGRNVRIDTRWAGANAAAGSHVNIATTAVYLHLTEPTRASLKATLDKLMTDLDRDDWSRSHSLTSSAGSRTTICRGMARRCCTRTGVPSPIFSPAERAPGVPLFPCHGYRAGGTARGAARQPA